MQKDLVYVGGSKGGTGKSMVCMALVDYFRKTFPKDTILLFETDSSNPDVGRLYRETKGVTLRGLILNEDDSGWMALVDAIDETKANHILINSMAASNLGIQTQGTLLDQNILDGNLEVNFKVFWVMNRNKDSVTLLRDFLSNMKSATVYPVLNLYFGKEEEFSFYRANEDLHEEIAAMKNQGFLWRSWGVMMSMVVLLGAICVNAGYVMGSGKYPFWLTPKNTLSKIAGYFLNVPSGWILLLGSSPFLLKSFFESASALKRNSRLGINKKKGGLVMKAIGSFISLIAIAYITIATF